MVQIRADNHGDNDLSILRHAIGNLTLEEMTEPDEKPDEETAEKWFQGGLAFLCGETHLARGGYHLGLFRDEYDDGTGHEFNKISWIFKIVKPSDDHEARFLRAERKLLKWADGLYDQQRDFRQRLDESTCWVILADGPKCRVSMLSYLEADAVGHRMYRRLISIHPNLLSEDNDVSDRREIGTVQFLKELFEIINRYPCPCSRAVEHLQSNLVIAGGIPAMLKENIEGELLDYGMYFDSDTERYYDDEY